MDGNGRWATSRGLPRNFGHKEGCKNIKEILNQCKSVGVKVLSLFAFSQENWKRPQEEINYIFKYIYEFLLENETYFGEQNIKLLVMGDTTKLPLGLQNILDRIIKKTMYYDGFIVNIGLNYGSQQEILRAINNIYKDNYKNSKVAAMNKDLKFADILPGYLLNFVNRAFPAQYHSVGTKAFQIAYRF